MSEQVSRELEYPISLPDGVIYRSPGCVEYPKEHSHAIESAALQTLAADSEAMCERIEKLIGQRFISLRAEKGWLHKAPASIGPLPPLMARIFGRWGRNMDGNTLITYGRQVWERNAYSRKWKRLCP